MMMNMRLTLALLLSGGAYGQAYVSIHPGLVDPKFIEINIFPDCAAGSHDFVVRRQGQELQVLATRRFVCATTNFNYTVRVDGSCVEEGGCEGPFRKLSLRIVDEQGCGRVRPGEPVPVCVLQAPETDIALFDTEYVWDRSVQSVFEGFGEINRQRISMQAQVVRHNGQMRVLVHRLPFLPLELKGVDQPFAVLHETPDTGSYYFYPRFGYPELMTPSGAVIHFGQTSSNGEALGGTEMQGPGSGATAVDPRRLPGRFLVMDDRLPVTQFDLQECLAPQLAGTLQHVCPITANGAAAGHLSCVPYNSNRHGLNTPICQLTLIGSGRTLQREMSVRQFTLGAWYGDVEVQADEPCCVRFRRPFAVRVAGP